MFKVPDDAISAVWDSIRSMEISGKRLCYCNSALPAGVLGGADEWQTAVDCLEEPAWTIYQSLSRELLPVAKRKNPDRDYAETERELNR